MNEKIIGILAGLMVGVIVCIVIFYTANNNRKLKSEYDERQNAVRGKAFKYGFYTALALLGVLIFLESSDIELPADQSVIYMGVMCLSITVNAVYSIIYEGYWGLNNNKRRYEIFMALIALFNLVITVLCYRAGILFHDGKLGLNGINLLGFAMFIILFITILIKDIYSKMYEGGEEEE